MTVPGWVYSVSLIPDRSVIGDQVFRHSIYGGTSEIMKTIIARDLTGLRA